ncbi:AP-1-like transcription factor [Escovopsis weberi]|uniref:AP-1-like transcription factor n=1 Tax=Escovopsis weberi TaxID=150374 RepID=A0A0N0RSV3_ESCWE|nr:AP-1-like transcription factor [Escovopsis weberi]
MSTVICPSPMPDQQPKMSMTSKEWVIPPRPKPGRKPATDTPPTKRKAQNRAAQRAFRERRAARVGELEELLEDQKKSNDSKEQELNQKIRDLEMEVQSFRSRCLLLESMLERERQERIRAEMQAEAPSRRHDQGSFRMEYKSYNPQMEFSSQQNQHRHSLPDERFTQGQASRHFSISQIITPPETTTSHESPHDLNDASLSCGNCTPNGACACAEEALASVVNGCGKCGFGNSCMCLTEAMQITNEPESLKRPASSSGPGSGEKRPRPDAPAPAESEVDFTSLFSKKPTPNPPQPPSVMSQLPSIDASSFRDSCGFCKEGTYCLCAEAAMAAPAMTPTEKSPAAQPLPKQTRTPPPSDHDVQPPLAMEMTADGAVVLPRRKPKNRSPQKAEASPPRGCGPNGPGTCAQCQADPKSGLFCRLMAANLDREQGKSGGCCGGKGAKGGCCKSEPNPKKSNIILPSLPSLGLSCAEAYQTLSSHRNFEKAADDIGSWLPKLKATPAADSRTSQPGRMPIEVEAASIMSVLKEFDVRFDRDA